MLKAEYKKYELKFIRPGTTSRGTLMRKTSWFIFLYDTQEPDIKGIGECNLVPGLSFDDGPYFEKALQRICSNIQSFNFSEQEVVRSYPSIRFGLETAFLDFKQKARKVLFPSAYTKGEKSIDINGLVWMGEMEDMKEQIDEKISQGYRCIKLKVGALDFSKEVELISGIREKYTEEEMMIRLDANGAFDEDEVMKKLDKLAEFGIHSIEQPVARGDHRLMAYVCRNSPIPIALDEELIGICGKQKRLKLLNKLKPQYLVLKPGVHGGFSSCDLWIEIADEMGMDWWATSALESNIGLNAIAQWTATKEHTAFHGLGTGMLYSNNFESPLSINNGKIAFDPDAKWNLENLLK